MVMSVKNHCEVCLKALSKKPVIHVAGFPEREHVFCSEKCLNLFLRMEDDELEYRDYFSNRKNRSERRNLYVSGTGQQK